MHNTPILLTRKLEKVQGEKALTLFLSAQERTVLRGHRTTSCGKDVLLQLPRTGPLLHGDLLGSDSGFFKVRVEAAVEKLLIVRAKKSLELLKAAYHLGNRHVELELHLNKILLLSDSVIAEMLRSRGLIVEEETRTFFPELGAYAGIHSHQGGQ